MDRQSFSAADPLTLPDLVFIQNDRNTGFAGGNNVALSCLVQAEAYILLLNPDMTVDPNALDEMVRLAGREPDAVIGSVHRSFNDPGMTIQYGGARVNYWSGNTSFIKTPEQVDRIDYISGGCLLADAAVYRAVGILPEDYFLYWEETDWCYRAQEKGFSMRVCTEAITFDKRSTTIGNGFLAEYFYTRNGLLFLKKYKRRYLFTAFMLVIARVAKKLVLGQPARAGGMVRGVVDFVTGRKYENQ
jgi:GT2 family glycosyltransferase